MERVYEVLTIINGLHLAKETHHACNKYINNAKNPPSVQLHRAEVWPTKQARRELKDIVFKETNDRWVHHPHIDGLVVTARVANRNVHCLMVDDGSTIDILYLNTYKKWPLLKMTCNPTTPHFIASPKTTSFPKE